MRSYPKNMFQTDVFNLMCGFDSDFDELHCILDERMSRDLIGFCKPSFMDITACYSFKHGLIYYPSKDIVYKARLITQPLRTNNAFFYGLSFMDAFDLSEMRVGTKTIIRNVFVGLNESRFDIADICGIAEVEQYQADMQVCDMEHSGGCLNHQTLFPFCQCTLHAHGCLMEPTQADTCDKIRIIIPFMEPLLRPEAHKVDTSSEAELLKRAFAAWKNNTLDGKELELLNIIHMCV